MVLLMDVFVDPSVVQQPEQRGRAMTFIVSASQLQCVAVAHSLTDVHSRILSLPQV